jgi:hypothetical protein
LSPAPVLAGVQFLGFTPLGINRKAVRTGGASSRAEGVPPLAERFIAFIHGNAIETPAPRNKVRRDRWWLGWGMDLLAS